MQALARARTTAARWRQRAEAEPEDVFALLDEVLDLTDSVRAECAHLQPRCVELEQQVVAGELETRALVEQMPAALIQTDRSGIILDANRAAAALLGLSKARLKNELLMYFTEDRAAFAELIRRLPQNSEPVRTEARIRPRERAPFTADIMLVRDPRGNEGRWLWFLSRVTAGQSSACTHVRPASALSPSESSAN